VNVSWFKGLARNLRDGGLKSGAWYAYASQIYPLLERMSKDREATDREVHILTGNDRLTMALWMVASWIASTGLHWRFVFHDDGNLSESQAENVRRLLPGCRVISDAESNDVMRSALIEYPLAWQCRNLHPLCRKLFDVPHFAEGSHLLTIDTDILFFRKPERLLQWIERSDDATIFLKDVADSTLPSAISASQMLGREIVRSINTGIVAMPRAAVTLDDIEHCLSRTQIMEEDPWFIEQSLYAMLASVRGDVEFLGDEYYMPIVGMMPSNAVARHYMGKVRHLFYSEGLPVVAGMLRSPSAMAN
jgi:hypothetical protein